MASFTATNSGEEGRGGLAEGSKLTPRMTAHSSGSDRGDLQPRMSRGQLGTGSGVIFGTTHVATSENDKCVAMAGWKV